MAEWMIYQGGEEWEFDKKDDCRYSGWRSLKELKNIGWATINCILDDEKKRSDTLNMLRSNPDKAMGKIWNLEPKESLQLIAKDTIRQIEKGDTVYILRVKSGTINSILKCEVTGTDLENINEAQLIIQDYPVLYFHVVKRIHVKADIAQDVAGIYSKYKLLMYRKGEEKDDFAVNKWLTGEKDSYMGYFSDPEGKKSHLDKPYLINVSEKKDLTDYLENDLLNVADEKDSVENANMYLGLQEEDAKNVTESANDNEDGFFGNTILYGPSGTGKTYYTVIYAVAICKHETIESVEEMGYEEVMEEYGKLSGQVQSEAHNQFESQNLMEYGTQVEEPEQQKAQIYFTTFHPSYSYEDFMEGIKPDLEEQREGTYKIESGVFKKFCEEAGKEENKNKNYVFIIDEINRGNISDIFGELLTLIEDSKREKMTVNLSYSGEPFTVPENVYILGTMNTADHSMPLMDTALRRRFKFVEKMPEPKNVFGKLGIETIEDGRLNLVMMLETMNKRIEVLYDREHTIGHAYFIELQNNPSIEKLGELFRKSIIPLLQEYFYGDYGKIQLVLGDTAKENADYKFITDKSVDQLFAEDEVFNNLDAQNREKLGLPEKVYEINEGAFGQVESYIQIYKKM